MLDDPPLKHVSSSSTSSVESLGRVAQSTTSPTESTRGADHSDEQYWLALGEFIEAFSDTEADLFMYVCRITEWSLDIARAAADSWRIEALVQFIRRIWKVRPLAEQTAEMEAVLKQLMNINSLRNSVIHNRSFVSIDGHRISSNKLRRQKATETHVSPALLHEAADDLIKISGHLITAVISPDLSLEMRAESMPILDNEWRYKPNAHPLS